jgi:hypothetical protein
MVCFHYIRINNAMVLVFLWMAYTISVLMMVFLDACFMLSILLENIAHIMRNWLSCGIRDWITYPKKELWGLWKVKHYLIWILLTGIYVWIALKACKPHIVDTHYICGPFDVSSWGGENISSIFVAWSISFFLLMISMLLLSILSCKHHPRHVLWMGGKATW